MDNIRILLVIFLSTLLYLNGFPQEIEVQGYFRQDSAMLGERVTYVLKAKYPSSLPVLFPDSTYNFGTMEFLGKESYPSFTEEGITQDSAVYYLSNFSLDPVRKFRLPVYEILRYDSISHYPEEAELILKLTIDEIPDVLTFQETNSYQKINQPFNYPYLIVALVAFLIVALTLVYFFGKTITNKWKAYWERRRWRRFVERWDLAKKNLVKQPTVDGADELLGLWKGYLEKLTGRPYKEWTATEISKHLHNQDILNDFRKIELIIYANRITEDVHVACENLLQVSNSLLEEKLKNIHDHE
ncbi:hypothetical protein [Negadavirga shengliensis]|uniref:Oxygen tolerance n=1 Tax=Negadavirga shengliensis TaxID=1389218 RepID=A0ABV9T4T0_9BACT